MKRRRSDLIPALLFLAPNFIGFLAFVAFPLLFSFFMAFTNWDLSLHNRFRDEAIKFTGFQNFVELVQHADFWKYLGNTFFLMLGIPVSIAGSLFLATLLTRPMQTNSHKTRGFFAIGSVLSFAIIGFWLMFTTTDAAGGPNIVAFVFCLIAGVVLAMGFSAGSIVYRTLFYFPSFTSGVAIYLLWKQMYNPQRGPINRLLEPFLNKLTAAVAHTPNFLWQGIGVAFWAVAGLVVILTAISTIRKRLDNDFGNMAAFMRLLVFFVFGLALYGIGTVFMGLPAAAAESGLHPPNWLADVSWAKPAIIIMGLWATVGSNNMLLYIAGISNIPSELYEAADIDGASRWQRFWHVTWPQLAPTTFFIVVMSVIGGLQGGFEQARTMTQGGPYGSTTTLTYFVYNEGFETGHLGFASAVAWGMFAMIFILTLVNYKFGNRYVNE